MEIQTTTSVPAIPSGVVSTTTAVSSATPVQQASPPVAAKPPRLAKPWTATDKLLTYLGIWENGVENGKNFAHQMVTDGFILTVYNDSRKLPTVGCGHLVVEADKLKLGDTITKVRAQDLLKSDLKKVETALNKNITVALYQYEYDALVSITFNAGTGGALDDLAAEINSAKYEDIPGFIEKFRAKHGNEGRRTSEANLFKNGVYDASH